jgi:hypothetical protein
MDVRTIAALALFLCVSASGAIAQSADVIRKVQDELELKRLHGAWVPDLLITDDGARAYPLSGRLLVFSDGNFFGRYEGLKRNPVASGTFKIEDSFLRLTVDNRTPWDLETGGVKTKVQYAFKVDGDVMTLCYTLRDKGKAGDLTPGKGKQVVVYRRYESDGKGKLVPVKP